MSIGVQRTGKLLGIIISAIGHEGLTVTSEGRPAFLAVVDADGKVIASGQAVADEAEAVAVNLYRASWIGEGRLRVFFGPAVGTNPPEKPASPNIT